MIVLALVSKTIPENAGELYYRVPEDWTEGKLVQVLYKHYDIKFVRILDVMEDTSEVAINLCSMMKGV